MAKKKKILKKDEEYLNEKFGANSSTGTLTAEEISDKYTVAELKYILKENGLKVSGKKQDLVERVLPILNENAPNDSELKETAQIEDSSPLDDVDLTSPLDEQITSTLNIFGIDYEELPIEEKTEMGDITNLNIKGFTQNGLSMCDFNMSLAATSDSSNSDLKMKIPEVSYTNFENTLFTFNNLDLSILPSSNPQSLEFSAIMDSLEIITESNYVNLKSLDLFFKSYHNETGICLDIDIKSFIYPNFNDTSINFENLDFNISIGFDGQILGISANLPKLNLMNKNYRVNLSDLNLNITLTDLKLSSLDLSALIPDFHYTNFDDVRIDMNNIDVSLEPITNSSSANLIIHMDGLNATGINSFDEVFPMLNINAANIKTPSADSEPAITLKASVPLLDVSKIGLTSLSSLLISGLDIDTYISNMPSQYNSSPDADAIDVSSSEVSDSGSSRFDLGMLLENCDYSGLDAIKLDLTGLLDSADIDLSDFGIDVSNYELSDISVSELIDILGDSEFIMTSVAAISKLFNIDFDKLDLSGLITNFDVENFDITSLLESLNLSELDITGIMDMFTNSEVDFGKIFENCDYSCLDAIGLNLTGLIDSLGIDLTDLGIDMSDYDLSNISLSELIGILSNIDIDMSTISALLKIFGLELDDIDLKGLMSSFDAENFDITSLLESLNLSELDITSIMDMFTNSEVDFESMFENIDYSCLDAIKLDLTGLLDSTDIDLSDFGIDMSDYDLSNISLSELIDALINSEFIMTAITAISKSFSINFDNLDMSGLINNFDAENFDISGLLESLKLFGLDISSMMGDFDMNGLDLTEFLNSTLSLLIEKTFLDTEQA